MLDHLRICFLFWSVIVQVIVLLSFPPRHTQIVHYTYLIFFSAYGIVYMADMQQKFEFYANNIIIAFLTLWDIQKSFNSCPSFTNEKKEVNG